MPVGMLNYFLLFAVIFTSLIHIYGYNVPRINNGVKTPLNLFQFAVRVYSGGCSGTIISKRHVLTAAHCLSGSDRFIKHERYQEIEHKYRVDIREGIKPVDYKMENGSMVKVYMPITWKKSGGSDLAIYEYPEGTNFGVEPVKLAKDYVEKEGDEVFIAGFGNLGDEREKTRGWTDLYHVNVTLITECFGTLRVCGGNRTHRALLGDSGGPMLISRNNQWYQIGVSTGTGDYDYRTRVSSYCNFIEEMTQNEVKCESIFPERKNQILLTLKHFEPIYQGQSTPLKLFDFIVPLYNYYYNEGCTATVISKRHLLTSARCVYVYAYRNVNKKLNITDHSKSYRTLVGKLFPDFRSKNIHPNLNNDPIDVMAYFLYWYQRPNRYNLAVVEFPEGTNFEVEPIPLASDYFPVYMDNGTFIVAGYGDYNITKDMHIKESTLLLQHSNNVPSGGNLEFRKVANEKLQRDEGGPVLIERNGKFYQIAVNDFFDTSDSRTRTSVTQHCSFIEEVTKNEVQCESTAPIYERPYLSTTTLPQNQELSSIAPTMNQFQSAASLILILFCLL